MFGQSRSTLTVALVLALAGTGCPKKPGTTATPTLTAVQVLASSTTIPDGASLTLKATALYSDKSTGDVTTQATWGSSDQNTVNVPECTTPPCTASGTGIGTAVVTASFGGLFGTANITVTDASLIGLTASVGSSTIPKGTNTSLIATGSYSDGSTGDVTSMVTWTPSDPTAVSVTGGLITGLQIAQINLTATLGGQSSSTSLTITAPVVSSVAITPTMIAITQAQMQTFQLIATMTDLSTQDITSSASWSSSDQGVASVTSPGVISGVGSGTATITAQSGVFRATQVISVVSTPVTGLSIDQASPELFAGHNLSLSATGTFATGSPADVTNETVWSSSDQTVAVAVNGGGHSGQITALNAGTTTITASIGTVTAQVTLTVDAVVPTSIVIGAAEGQTLQTSLPAGYAERFVAEATNNDGTMSDVTGQVTWDTSDHDLAFILDSSDSGVVVEAKAQGTVNVTATIGEVSQSLQLTVLPPSLLSIAVTAAQPVTVGGGPVQLTAMGTYSDQSQVDITDSSTWSGSNADATIDPTTGLLTPLGNGLVNATATNNSIVGSLLINVTN